MYDRLRNTLDGIEGSLDQVLAALGQNLYNYVCLLYTSDAADEGLV